MAAVPGVPKESRLTLRDLNGRLTSCEPASWCFGPCDTKVLEVRLGARETKAASGTVGVMVAARAPGCHESIICMWHPPTADMMASDALQVQEPVPLMHKTAHQLQLLGQPAHTMIEVVTPNLPEAQDFQLLECQSNWRFVVLKDCQGITILDFLTELPD